MTDTYSPVTKEPDDTYGQQTKDLDKDELLIRIKDWFAEDSAHCREWHDEAREDFAFRAGDQWLEEDKVYMEEKQKRACLTFNRVDPIIDAVVGAEISNRQEVRYIPRQLSDAPANEIFTEAARWFRDECDAEHEESSAFADAATCGMGWTETKLEYETNPDGAPKVERIDPIEMFWDHVAKEANLTDARRVYRVRQEVPLDEAQARWPGMPDESSYDATWAATEESDTPHISEVIRNRLTPNADEGKPDRTVTLVQCQWWEREDYYRAIVTSPPTEMGNMVPSQPADLTPEQHTAAQSRATQLGMQYRAIKQIRKCYYEAFLGGEVLEINKIVAPSGKPAQFFNFVPITGKFDSSKNHFYGLVKPMKGPQRYANKWLSTAVEMMARGAKGGLLLEGGAVEDEAEFEANWAKPGANAYLKSGALSGGRVQEKPRPQFPSDFMQMTQFAISSIRDVTNVSVELLGMAGHEQPASLEYQRRQSSTVSLAPLFDSLRRYRKIEGRILLFLISEYLSDGRLIRIVGQDQAQYVPLLKQPGVQEYDIIVDDAPTSPNQKEMVWGSLVQMLPLLQGIQPPPEMILKLMEYSPLPQGLVLDLQKMAAQRQASAPPPPPSPAEIKAQEAQIEMQADTQSKAADAQYKAQDHEMEYAHKERMANLEYQVKAREAGLRAQELDLKAKTEHAAKMKDFDLNRAAKMDEFALKKEERDAKAKETKDHTSSMVKPVADAVGSSLLQGLTELAKAHATATESLRNEIRKPKKRTLVRGKDGRATHTVEEIIH